MAGELVASKYRVCERCNRERYYKQYDSETPRVCKECLATELQFKRTESPNLEIISARLMNILDLETRALMAECAKGKLNRDESAALVIYLTMTKDLMKKHAEDTEALSDADLKKIAGGDGKAETNS